MTQTAVGKRMALKFAIDTIGLSTDDCALIADALDVLQPDDTGTMERRDELVALFRSVATGGLS